MVLVPNVLLVFTQELEPATNAQHVLQAKLPPLVQLLTPPVKIVLVRLMDVLHALIPVLPHAQNALQVMV